MELLDKEALASIGFVLGCAVIAVVNYLRKPRSPDIEAVKASFGLFPADALGSVTGSLEEIAEYLQGINESLAKLADADQAHIRDAVDQLVQQGKEVARRDRKESK